MAAGALPELFAFDRRTATDDGAGNLVADFAEEFQTSAAVLYLKGEESVRSAALTGIQPVRIRVRQSTDTDEIAPDWRARDVRAGTTYNIKAKSPSPVPGRYLDIVATSGEAA
jgi:head-tail adaptor